MIDVLCVLMVEDSEADAKLIAQALRASVRSLEIERVESAASMKLALETRAWDVILCDWSLPGFSALGALDVLRHSELHLPFILVSGTVGEEIAADAMRAGAHDYVLKDRLARLVPAIERELLKTKAAKALRVSEARFARLSDAGIVGIVEADVHGNIVDANDAYLRILGYSREDLVLGKVGWAAMTPPEWRARDDVANEELRRTGVAVPWEKELIRKDGSRASVLIGVAMLEPPQCIAFTVDLTTTKRTEAKLRESDAQLRQAQKMEAVGRLAGGVAHDFNNMLSVILSYSEILLADLASSDPSRADADEIRKAGQRAADLTRQLLMFSRQQVIEPRVVDMNDLLSNMHKMLTRLLGEDVDLTLTNGAKGRVMVDPSSLEQLVVNLVVNARDAMPTGGQLTIETADVVLDDAYAREHLGASPGRHVMLAVTDSGTGMDAQTRSRIFEPFFTTKEKGKGTGLGLSTAFGIASQSGGSIWVYSELGKGTVFKVYLPRVEATVDAHVTSIAPTAGHGWETVLVVEDEDQVRAVACGILRRSGYTVIEARNAGEALLLCESHAGIIQLLLSDVVMPGMSGPELAKRLATTRPGMRVLCMSGYADDSIVRHGVLDAHFAFLQKPITPGTLARKVRSVLDVGGSPEVVLGIT
jgi:two-component system, cell cycle sensor histidine kinase and response regulator CckA